MARRIPTVLVTGATGGIGFAAAAALLHRGARVLVHGRSLDKAQAASARLLELAPAGSIRPVFGDLSRLDDVRALADQVLEEPRLDVVIHNAGLERQERHQTVDGLELTLTVNHLAPLLLTRRLAPLLERSAPSRVVFVSSLVHAWGTLRWDDLEAVTWYAAEPVYYQSKLAAALSALELARRLAPRGVTVLLVPPGLTRTNFGRDLRGAARVWLAVVGRLFFRAPEVVGRELAAVSLEEGFGWTPGAYVDRLVVRLPSPKALNEDDQLRLWTWSCERLGLPVDEPARAAPLPAPPPLRPRAASVVAHVALGEMLGFGTTALVAFVALSLGGHPETVRGQLIALVTMVLAGTIEGASLGYFQWRALRRWLPALQPRPFVGATVVVAAGGWLVGMSVPLIATIQGVTDGGGAPAPSASSVAAFAAGFGLVAGALFGLAQGAVLRRHVDGVRWWIGASSLGWAAGLPIAYLAGSLGSEAMSVGEAAGLSLGAGLGMGLAVGVATYAATRRMRPRANG
jgi:NAD(P)-dependent dehydrogenase (short-subunit alcohol dehydrogenase family)